MNAGDLYPFVILLILIGLVTGVGVLILDKFAQTSGLTTAAETALNNSRDAITPIASTWLGLLVTIVVLAIILGVVINSFAKNMSR